jgi:hypothetical protein
MSSEEIPADVKQIPPPNSPAQAESRRGFVPEGARARDTSHLKDAFSEALELSGNSG